MMTAGFLESLLAKTHPFPKTRWLYLVAPRCRCSPSRLCRGSPSSARDVTTYCISLIGAGCRFLVQPSSSISGMRMPWFSAAMTETATETATFAPGIGFCPGGANRYTFYALRLVVSVLFASPEYHVRWSPLIQLPVETYTVYIVLVC